MQPLEGDQAPCRLLLVTDTNLLDDSVEAAMYRELCRALTEAGVPCAAVGRFLVPGDQEVEPAAWLAERRWASQATLLPLRSELGWAALRLSVANVPVILFQGPSTRPHVLADAERTSFLSLVETTLDERRPDVVLARAGSILADVLAAARARHLATVALQPDCALLDAASFREAEVILTPTRFGAAYLRAAFGLPCLNLPPMLPREPVPAKPPRPGAALLDASTPGNDPRLLAQLAEAVRRRRPDLPLLVFGGTSPLELPGSGPLPAVAPQALGKFWESARVFVTPLVGWEYTPLAALSALSHGVPVVTSDRGAAPEMVERGGIVLPLPDRLTLASPACPTPAELAPWVDNILRLCNNDSLVDSLRAPALLARAQLAPENLVRRYAQLFTGLVGRRRPRAAVAPPTAAREAALRRLAEAHPWPAHRPEDAAPGQEAGWLGAGTERMLARALSPNTRLVVELGGWLGLSARFIADHAPAATVLSVDHWQGSAEHQSQEHFRALLPRLYETFLARCWEDRGRIIPLRMSTLQGLRTVAAAGLQPDLIYVDADHSYEGVMADLTLAHDLFPRTALGGDDYDWSGVRAAVDEFAQRHGFVVDRFGVRGWRLLDSWDAADANHPPPSRGQSVVLVPHLNGIEWECEQSLRQVEALGVRVVRRAGSSQIDLARSEMLSDALHDGAEAMLFIDADTGFDAQDAIRLLARPEPVVSGVYAKKGRRELASVFADEVKEVLFGPDVVGAYPLRYAATGFLRIRAGVLRRLIAELNLPLCNTHWGRGVWPFFLSLIVPHADGKQHYLGEDWSFSYRLAQIGVTPLADTTIRLWHWGRFGYGWEDAGSDPPRYRSYTYYLNRK